MATVFPLLPSKAEMCRYHKVLYASPVHVHGQVMFPHAMQRCTVIAWF